MLDVQSLTKYLLEGVAVAAAAYYIPRKSTDLKVVAMIAVTAAAVFAVLDQFAPAVSVGARQGAGFGIGYNITNGLEGFEDDTEEDEEDDSCLSDSEDDLGVAEEPEETETEETETDTDTDTDTETEDEDVVGVSVEPFSSIF
jgi:hypothetical protein